MIKKNVENGRVTLIGLLGSSRLSNTFTSRSLCYELCHRNFVMEEIECQSLCDGNTTFLSKLMEIAEYMKDQKESISDSMVITKILMSLPVEYNHFNSTWESTSTGESTMSNLRARLTAEEVCLRSQNQVDTMEALFMKTKINNKFVNQKSRPKNKKAKRAKA